MCLLLECKTVSATCGALQYTNGLNKHCSRWCKLIIFILIPFTELSAKGNTIDERAHPNLTCLHLNNQGRCTHCKIVIALNHSDKLFSIVSKVGIDC